PTANPDSSRRGSALPRHAGVPAAQLPEGDEDRPRLRFPIEGTNHGGPSSAARRDAAPAAGDPVIPAARMRTGIAGLDKMLHGGLVPGRPYLVYWPAGAGTT